MKHIKLFEEDLEDLIGDLEGIGFDRSIGYMFLSTRGDQPIAFLIKARAESRCVQALLGLSLENWFSTPPTLKYTSTSGPGKPPAFMSDLKTKKFSELMEFFFEQGYLPDAGYYGPFKAKDTSEAVIVFTDIYTINAKAFVDLAYEHFSNADERFRAYKADATKELDLDSTSSIFRKLGL